MTTINIIGVVMLIGGVLGYGALFLWVLTMTNAKRGRRGSNGTIAIHRALNERISDIPRHSADRYREYAVECRAQSSWGVG